MRACFIQKIRLTICSHIIFENQKYWKQRWVICIRLLSVVWHFVPQTVHAKIGFNRRTGKYGNCENIHSFH